MSAAKSMSVRVSQSLIRQGERLNLVSCAAAVSVAASQSLIRQGERLNLERIGTKRDCRSLNPLFVRASG